MWVECSFFGLCESSSWVIDWFLFIHKKKVRSAPKEEEVSGSSDSESDSEKKKSRKRSRSISESDQDSASSSNEEEEEKRRSKKHKKKHSKKKKKSKEHKKSKKSHRHHSSSRKSRDRSESPVVKRGRSRSRSPAVVPAVAAINETSPKEENPRYREYKDKVAEKPEWEQRRRFHDEPDVNFKGRGRKVSSNLIAHTHNTSHGTHNFILIFRNTLQTVAVEWEGFNINEFNNKIIIIMFARAILKSCKDNLLYSLSGCEKANDTKLFSEL